jgi:hypothetical protein
MHSEDLEKIIALPQRQTRRRHRRSGHQVQQAGPPRAERPTWFDDPDLVLRQLRQLYGREWWR